MEKKVFFLPAYAKPWQRKADGLADLYLRSAETHAERLKGIHLPRLRG